MDGRTRDGGGDQLKIRRVDGHGVLSAVRVIDHSCIRCTSALPQVKPPIRRRASRASRPRIFRVDGGRGRHRNTSRVFTIYFMVHTLSLPSIPPSAIFISPLGSFYPLGEMRRRGRASCRNCVERGARNLFASRDEY